MSFLCVAVVSCSSARVAMHRGPVGRFNDNVTFSVLQVPSARRRAMPLTGEPDWPAHGTKIQMGVLSARREYWPMGYPVRLVSWLAAAALGPICGCSDDDRLAAPESDPSSGGRNGTWSGGASSGGGGAMGSGGAQNTGGITPPADDQGQGDGTDVITIGDSYMFWFGEGIQRSLEKISGQTYRKYGMPGTFVLDEAIPNQYIEAWEEDADIKTVIMTGGGNDILASDCNPCDSLVDQTAARLQQLRERMGDDGVRDVIVVGYGYPERPRGPEVPAALDYYRELMGEQCLKDGPPPRCHFVDPSAVLVGKLRAIGGHPDVEGNDAMARMIWERMQAEGIRR